MSDSGHPPFSFLWPLAEVSRFRNLSSKSPDFKSCVVSLVLDLAEYGASISTISKILDRTNSNTANYKCNSSHGRLVTCIVPFHPAWGHSFDKIADEVVSEFQQILMMLRFPMHIKICWKKCSARPYGILAQPTMHVVEFFGWLVGVDGGLRCVCLEQAHIHHACRALWLIGDFSVRAGSLQAPSSLDCLGGNSIQRFDSLQKA